MADRPSFVEHIRSFIGRYALALAVLWTLGILVAFSVPTPNLPAPSLTLDVDKIVHAVLFAGLGILWMRALQPATGDTPRHAWKRGAGLFLAGALFATLTEVYQHVFLARRLGDPYDAASDIIGLGLSIAAYASIRTLQSAR